MKKKLAILLALVLGASLLTACGSSAPASSHAEEVAEDVVEEAAEETPEEAAEETPEESAEAPAEQAEAEAESSEGDYGPGFVFKHGFDLDYPPYSHLDDDGQVSGFDVEMAQAVCEYYGWTYEPVPFNWDAKDAELNAGSCDCIWSGFTMNGREDDYTWSIPYSDNTQLILVKEDSGITGLADLAGKIVGVQTATSAYDLLQDEEGQKELCDSFASLEVFETYTIAFNDLKAGAIDAIAIDVTSGTFLMNNEGAGYTFLEEPLGTEQYGVGFRKEDTVLRDLINDALMALTEEGKVSELAANYPDIEQYLCLGES